MELKEKYKKLQNNIKNLEKAVIAFSGGVDSTLLAKVCYNILGENALAITAIAPFHSKREIEDAIKIANEIGIRHKTIKFDMCDIEDFKYNPWDRCYICKRKIFSKIKEIAHENGISSVLDGSNVDDVMDYRPGLKALRELSVKSPLKDADMTKSDIRQLSKDLGLSTWDKPALACLATRIPYGEEITKIKLKMIEESENYLENIGFKQFRLRYHGNLARIEVAPDERTKLFDLELMDKISNELKKIGFTYVTIELSGYKTGSMNKQKNN